MLDPFGITSLEETTRYWTVFEKTSELPPLDGTLLNNRILWMVIGTLLLLTAYVRFPFSLDRSRKQGKSKAINDPPDEPPVIFELASATQEFNLATSWRQYLSQTQLEIRNIVFSAPFVTLLLLGIFMVVGNAAGNLGNIFGTAVHPTTGAMVRILNGAFSFSLVFCADLLLG